ncbi:hypothetical protein QJS04_geneDACA011786 [Acorus gramineus]|uniref:Uncharacterized protein n=1 Tax=Acorus gramineus TaxID=55184 RepID=A0AAV9BJS3_ACOGR|nr:hypothetical protein QJS04_geneDACA011786 [Acorus gramineus]
MKVKDITPSVMDLPYANRLSDDCIEVGLPSDMAIEGQRDHNICDLPVQLACITTQFDRLSDDGVEVESSSVMASEGQRDHNNYSIVQFVLATHMAKVRKLGHQKVLQTELEESNLTKYKCKRGSVKSF